MGGRQALRVALCGWLGWSGHTYWSRMAAAEQAVRQKPGQPAYLTTRWVGGCLVDEGFCVGRKHLVAATECVQLMILARLLHTLYPCRYGVVRYVPAPLPPSSAAAGASGQASGSATGASSGAAGDGGVDARDVTLALHDESDMEAGAKRCWAVDGMEDVAHTWDPRHTRTKGLRRRTWWVFHPLPALPLPASPCSPDEAQFTEPGPPPSLPSSLS